VTKPLRIVVTGLAATYPFGGVFWDYLQYVLGFHRMGHDVLYLEDTGQWAYDPSSATFVEDGTYNASLLASHLRALEADLITRWFYRDGAGHTFGRPWVDVVDFCRRADLFVHVSASCWMREEYFAARRVVFIDSDPMYTQSSVPEYVDGTVNEAAKSRVDMLLRHDRHFTFGENVGRADCRIPTNLFDWVPTRQPIVMSCFDAHRHHVVERRQVMTTVASWEPNETGPVVRGIVYSGKSTEFLRFIDLPRSSPVPLEVALSGRVPSERLTRAGWRLEEPLSVSGDPWVYREYLAQSMGEFSVAKNAYVAGRTGWFSCRSACYLALGVPVVVQDTGFTRNLPAGEGLLAFETADEAVRAIDEVLANPAKHAAAAEHVAATHFDASAVLNQLIEHALS
jgi:hypothetical protein